MSLRSLARFLVSQLLLAVVTAAALRVGANAATAGIIYLVAMLAI